MTLHFAFPNRISAYVNTLEFYNNSMFTFSVVNHFQRISETFTQSDVI